MNKQKQLFEGLQENDLRDLVLPLLSIDEYLAKSGSDDEVIVVAFFVHDQSAAVDLTRFCSKSGDWILDVEVSPAPNPEGYWLVFLEMFRDENIAENIILVLDELKTVTGISKWKAKIYNVGLSVDVSENTLKKYIRVDANQPNDKVDSSKIQEWLDQSQSKFQIKNNQLHEDQSQIALECLFFGDESQIPQEYECHYCLGTNSKNAKNLQKSLGNRYSVTDYGNWVAISRENSPEILLAKFH